MQARAGEGVERRERLVEEQHLRVGHEGAGDGDALLLAAGEIARPARARARRGRPCRARAPTRARRSARAGPARPKPTLSATVSQGSSRGSWKTMPTAGCGSAIASPSRRIAPALARSRPGDEAQQRGLAAARAADERHDLALLDGEGDVGERARAVRIGLGEVLEGQHLRAVSRAVSCQRTSGRVAATSKASQTLPRSAKAMMAARIWSGLPSLLAVDEQIAEALGRAHELGRDHEHEAEAEARAQRRRSGSGSTAGRRMRRASWRAGQPKDAADLDELAVDRQDRARDAEIDRKEDADGDQRDLRCLEDAEPQDEQRHPGERRDGAQRLQRRIEERGALSQTCR